MRPTKSASWFVRLAKWTAHLAGTPRAFLVAALTILLWAALGPVCGWSDTWQLVINTSTTIITFLMVFLIQNTQNRDTEALQIKLDEVLRVLPGAHTVLLDLEELDAAELGRIRALYQHLAAQARRAVHEGTPDTGSPEVELP